MKDKTEEEPEDVVLVCLPVTPNERTLIQGSAIRECTDCRRPIWVAPTGQKIEKEKRALLVCLDCASVRLKNDKDAHFERPTPEQIKEIEKQLRWDQARRYRGKPDTIV